MKRVIKFIVVGIVILGLVATYVLTGLTPSHSGSNFQGPSGQPHTNGPSTPPPIN